MSAFFLEIIPMFFSLTVLGLQGAASGLKLCSIMLQGIIAGGGERQRPAMKKRQLSDIKHTPDWGM